MTSQIPSVAHEELKFNDQPAIIWIKVRDAVELLWKDNPKLHDIGSVVQSIQKYGLQELPKYDATLAAIKAGNGRIEALAMMEKQKMDVPRGIASTKEGEWVMPLLAGVDAESVTLAKAYAIDSNNLVMSGGDLTGVEQSFAWNNNGYLDLLKALAEEESLPISVDGNLLDALNKYYRSPQTPLELTDNLGDLGSDDLWPIIRIKVPPETFEKYRNILLTQNGTSELEKFQALLESVSE
jgi:hypothetical protein